MRSYSTSQLAEKYQVPQWRVRRALDVLEALGIRVDRIGSYRAIRADQLLPLEAELRRVGALKEEVVSK